MSLDLTLLGSKLRRCREQLQLGLQEVSSGTGIQDSVLGLYEEGQKEPTGDHILILADFYKYDYRFFISNERVAAFEETETLFRRHSDDFSREDRRAVQEFLFLCESEQFLLDNLPDWRTVSFSFSKTGSYFKGHGADAADKLRKAIGYQDHEVPLDVFEVFRRIGIHVFRRNLHNSSISGLFIKHPVAGKCVLVNYDEDVYRQRFTVAHEAGHSILDENKDFIVSFVEGKGKIETRANTFASCFLIPRPFLKKLNQIVGTWNEKDAIHWANELKVNPKALGIALSESKLVSDSEKAKMMNLKIPKHLKSDPELPDNLSKGTYDKKKQLMEHGLSSFYVGLCFESYERYIISSGRLAEVLLCSEDELPVIAELYGRVLHYAD